jgi:hypothetical protein
MHAVPPDDRFTKDLRGCWLRPGFKPPENAAILGGKVNERLGKRPISPPDSAHSQDLIDFSAAEGI